MDLGIKGKLALVIGGSQNIGRAVAVQLAREGCRVVTVGRHAGLYEDLEAGCLPHSLTIDLMQEGGVFRLQESMIRLGYAEPDIIYHAIGGSWEGLTSPFCSSEEYAKVWRFNLGLSIDINNLFLKGMMTKRWGRIVHTSTDATKCNSGNSPYTSSKFAVEGYVATVSKILVKDGVIMTAVAPGPIHTPGRWSGTVQDPERAEYFKRHLPAGRFGDHFEVARMVAALCGEPASFMPGAIVRIDGGSR